MSSLVHIAFFLKMSLTMILVYLVVDEEQRFGVTHKEKLKQLKTNVDVLTLTATPIPRTLHMSMLGVRDLSVIETPPANRFPVQTYVMEHNFGLVREAIEREMGRGGQIFYLYNRVEDMTRKVDEIKQLVPEARVGFAHGQMGESALESVILSFLEGEYDVLVTTTIIETGIDIPNVNTLIVHDADRMGLSQLYQLRGRVGRSNRVAYAYFLYQRDKVLTEVAENRLQAIKEFTELGSGFKIAMRDLSIRGAGNLTWFSATWLYRLCRFRSLFANVTRSNRGKADRYRKSRYTGFGNFIAAQCVYSR